MMEIQVSDGCEQRSTEGWGFSGGHFLLVVLWVSLEAREQGTERTRQE